MFSNARNRIAMIAGACAIAAAAILVSSRTSQPEVKPGTTVLAMPEDGIRSITYQAGAMTLTARRVGAGPFAVQVAYRDGRAAQQCQVSRDLVGLLPDLSDIEARRQLTSQQLASEFPLEVGTMQLEDDVDEPISPFRVRMSKDRSAVALVYEGVAVEPDMSPNVFIRLEKGCAELAGDNKTATP